MINPLIDKRHLREYLLFGGAAGTAFIIPVIYFLVNNTYQNFFYLFLGSGLFMIVIFVYCLRLIKKPFDKKRSTAIVIAGHIATLAGIIIACILSTIIFLFFFPELFSSMPAEKVVENTPAWTQPHKPIGLLFIIFSVATIGNFSVGSFISLMMAYAGKVNQTKDKAVPLETHI